jgi:hypothetical protein
MRSWGLLPWQEYVLGRALETRGGKLRWRVVIVTVARQQGKSVLMRALSWWRIHQAERFGEPQLLLSTANQLSTAQEVWRPAALVAVERYGKSSAKWGRGAEQIVLPDDSGRWIVQAASPNTGVGFSICHANVDEAWNVPREMVDTALTPATSEREQPQIWLISTAGDSSSDLLRSYREQALQDTKGDGDILLLEWSAPPEAAYDDPATWRWASPHWSPRREAFLTSQLQAIPEAAFRSQYLNQWVASIDGWVPASVWADGYSTEEPPAGPPDVMAVEVAPDGTRFAAVNAWQLEAGQVMVRSWLTASPAALWQHVEATAPKVLLLPPSLMVHYKGRKPAVQVGVSELHRHLMGVGSALANTRVLHHPEDRNLTEHVAVAVAVNSEHGLRLSLNKSKGPIEACRAMVWAVGECLRPSQPRPRVVAG